jgi:hypothetical protein
MEFAKAMALVKEMENAIVIQDIQAKNVIHAIMASMKPSRMKLNYSVHNAMLRVMEIARDQAHAIVKSVKKDGFTRKTKVASILTSALKNHHVKAIRTFV